MGRAVQQPLEFELKLEVGLEKALRYPVDVRILDPAPLSFQFAVVRDGQLMVDSDLNRRAFFESNVRKKYFDFAIFRRRYNFFPTPKTINYQMKFTIQALTLSDFRAGSSCHFSAIDIFHS